MKAISIIFLIISLGYIPIYGQSKSKKISPGSKVINGSLLTPFESKFDLGAAGNAKISLLKESDNIMKYEMALTFHGMGTFKDVISFSTKTLKPIKGISPLGPGKEFVWEVEGNKIEGKITSSNQKEEAPKSYQPEQEVFMGPQLNMLIVTLPLKKGAIYEIPILNSMAENNEVIMWATSKVIGNEKIEVDGQTIKTTKVDNGLFGTIWISKKAPFLIQWKMSESGGGTLWKLKSLNTQQ